MERTNAIIPTGIDDLAVGQEVFYILNTLVPEVDLSRIIGPLNSQELEVKRKMYEGVLNNLRPEERESHPLIVYRLTRL
jgi:hypothetical protein